MNESSLNTTLAPDVPPTAAPDAMPVAVAERPLILRLSVAVLSVVVAAAIRGACDPWLGNYQPFGAFYVAIGVATAFGGFVPGLVAIAGGWLIGDYYFVAPRGQWLVDFHRPELALEIGYILIGSGIAMLAGMVRRAHRRTERVAAQLEEQTARLRLAMEAAHQGGWEWDGSGQRVWLSPLAATLHGAPEKRSLPAREFEALIHPEDYPSLHAACERAVLEGYLESEYRVVLSTGEHRWLRARGQARGRGQAGASRVIGVIADITEERAAAEQLRGQHRLLETIFEAIDVGLSLIDAEGKLLRVNPAFARIVDHQPNEIIGRPFAEIFAETRPTAASAPSAAAADAAAEPYDCELRTRTGQTRFIRMGGTRKLAWNGASLAIRVVQDITAERLLREAQRESEERFRVLANSSPVMIWVTDADGRVMFVNQRYRQFFGRDEETVRAEGWQPLIHPEDYEAYRDEFHRAIRKKAGFRIQMRMRNARGEWRWVEAHGVPRFSATNEFLGHVGSSPDITDIKRAQEAMTRMNAELEQRVKDRTAKLRETVAELEAFSYSMAHDMRAPLRSMLGFAEIIEDEHAAQLDETARDYLRRITNAARRLDQLIVDVLDYSRVLRDEMPLGPLHVARVLDELLETYAALAAVRQFVTVAEPMPRVMANVAALTQVLSQLLTNAVKFVAPGTTPDVRVRAERVANVAGHAPRPHGWIRVWIEDNGIGIEPEFQPRLFKMFQRFIRPTAYEGTGMGLAIARKATERMGGAIGVESRSGKGSRFWIALPAADPTDERGGPDVAT